MSRAALVVVALVGGCFNDRGLTIEVSAGTTIATTVELYLGTDHCQDADCNGIAPPPSASPVIKGDVWYRDALVVDRASVVGGVARFHLTAAELQTESIPIVVAVGTSETPNQPSLSAVIMQDVVVPTDRGLVYDVTLKAAEPLNPATTATGLRVITWSKTSPASSCLAIQNGDASTIELIVPREDPDCDDVANECNPDAWHGSANASDLSATPNCVTHDQANAGRCELGLHPCTDDGGPTLGACSPSRPNVCLPDGFCSCTLDNAGSCLPSLMEQAGITTLECELPTTLSVGGTPTSSCPGANSAMVDLDALFTGTGCHSQPIELADIPLAVFGFAPTVTLNGLQLQASSANTPCSFELTWFAGMRDATATQNDHLILKIPTDDGKVIYLPTVLKVTPACDMITPACHLTGAASTTDLMWQCAE